VNRRGAGAGLNPVGTARCGARDLRPPQQLEGDLAMAPDLARNECASSPAWGSTPPPSAWRVNAEWSAARSESAAVPRGAEDRALRSPQFSGTSSGSWVPARLLRGELRQGEAGSTPARSAAHHCCS